MVQLNEPGPFPQPSKAEPPFTPRLSQFALGYLRILQFVQYGDLVACWPEGVEEVFSKGPPEVSERAAELSKHGAGLFPVAWWWIGTPNMRPDATQSWKFWRELAICRMVDGFHAYIASMLHSILLARPEILRSAGKIDVREIFECGTISEFAERLAVQKVDALTYGGFAAMSEYLEGLGISLSVDDKRLAVAAIATRNVIVHNEGRVNERFLKETGRTDVKIGSEVPLSIEELGRCLNGLRTVAFAIDKACIAKFGVAAFGG